MLKESDEHGSQGERGDQSAAAGDEDGRGADALGLNETLDTVRSGGRLILRYDAPSNSFRGTVENTTNGGVLTPRQDRSAPVEWCGAWTDDSHGPGSRRGAGDRPTRDAGIVHRLDSTRRGRWAEMGEASLAGSIQVRTSKVANIAVVASSAKEARADPAWTRRLCRGLSVRRSGHARIRLADRRRCPC